MLNFDLDPGTQRRPSRKIRNEREHAHTRRHASDRKEYLQEPERANEIHFLPRTPLKLRVHMNVVPRSTKNTNDETEN